MADNSPDPRALAKTETLIEALPYLQRYAGQTFVVKYGGHAMGNPAMAKDFADDIVLLKACGINVVVVHGGGPQIGAMLDRLGLHSSFVDGLRVTDAATAQVAEMVLAGSINKELVAWINAAGGLAAGISGKDANLVRAVKATRTTRDPGSNIEREVDLGFVGEPVAVNRTLIDVLTKANMVPVIAPVAIGVDGATYNVNADTIGAARLFLLTDVAGVLDKSGALLTDLNPKAIAALVADGTISGGMIPKIETCVTAVGAGVGAAVILDGRVSHAMLLEIFTRDGAGTLVRA
jgi:acetylglutamate kinase